MVQRRCLSGFIEPCQPSKVDRPPSGPLWVHEIKHDDYRLMVRKDGARVRCFTRNGHDWADRFPAIVEAASKILASSFLIDGEAVIARDAGLPCAAEPTTGHEAVLFAFRLGWRHRVKAAQKTHQRGSDFGGGDAHRVFTAAQNCSVTAVVSSVTFQPFVSAFSLANLCSISSIFLVSAYGFQSALDSLAEVFAPQTL
nr:hypothetical protein G6P99_13905 [Bradyrhizobium sp. 6(2017)]